MASIQSVRDVPMIIHSHATRSERRITPSWTISQFKAKLENITGIPPDCQNLFLALAGQDPVAIKATDEGKTYLSDWDLQPYAEIQIEDTRPAGLTNLNFPDNDSVPRYSMPQDTYENLQSSVLAWKKANHLGRFNPQVAEVERRKLEQMWQEVPSRDIEVSKRCELGNDAQRRGMVAYVGEVPEIPGPGGPWIGVILDEPTGKNDGSIDGKSYFSCPSNRGVFVRPDRVEVGDFKPLDLELDSDLEEL